MFFDVHVHELDSNFFFSYAPRGAVSLHTSAFSIHRGTWIAQTRCYSWIVKYNSDLWQKKKYNGDLWPLASLVCCQKDLVSIFRTSRLTYYCFIPFLLLLLNSYLRCNVLLVVLQCCLLPGRSLGPRTLMLYCNVLLVVLVINETNESYKQNVLIA